MLSFLQYLKAKNALPQDSASWPFENQPISELAKQGKHIL